MNTSCCVSASGPSPPRRKGPQPRSCGYAPWASVPPLFCGANAASWTHLLAVGASRLPRCRATRWAPDRSPSRGRLEQETITNRVKLVIFLCRSNRGWSFRTKNVMEGGENRNVLAADRPNEPRTSCYLAHALRRGVPAKTVRGEFDPRGS
jgi:hypothetical protein